MNKIQKVNNNTIIFFGKDLNEEEKKELENQKQSLLG